MRSVSKGVRRFAAVLAVSTIVVAHGAFAVERQDDRSGFLDRLARARQVVIKILNEFGFPPG
jgi:hypothetical protein